MAIVVRCECGHDFQTGVENAGRRVRCPVCQRELVVPQPKHLPDDELAELNALRLPGPAEGDRQPHSGTMLAGRLLRYRFTGDRPRDDGFE